MKKRTFTLRLLDGGNVESEVDSIDYDLENGLVRYKDGVYDIRTGLWVCRLSRLKKGVLGNDLNVLPECPQLKMTDMIKTITESRAAMRYIENARKQRVDYPTKNDISQLTSMSIYDII